MARAKKVAAAPATPARPRVAQSQRTSRAPGDVSVEYTERSPIRVRGAATGRLYEFSALQAVQAVDRGDAALLDSRFFRGTV